MWKSKGTLLSHLALFILYWWWHQGCCKMVSLNTFHWQLVIANYDTSEILGHFSIWKILWRIVKNHCSSLQDWFNQVDHIYIALSTRSRVSVTHLVSIPEIYIAKLNTYEWIYSFSYITACTISALCNV